MRLAEPIGKPDRLFRSVLRNEPVFIRTRTKRETCAKQNEPDSSPRKFLKVFPARLRPTEVDIAANRHPLICGGVEDSHKRVINVRISRIPFGLYCDLRGQV